MDQNITGLIVSYLFVFSVIILSTIIQKIFKLGSEFSRKIIHIAVGNWVFIALYYFVDWRIAIIPPASFILINYLSFRYSIFKAMELDDKNPGTVYYSISLAVLTFVSFIRPGFYVLPFLGIMAMTWGDGFAGVIGKKLPLKIIRNNKSLGGSLAFVVFAGLSSLIYLLIQNISLSFFSILLISVVFAIIGMFIELFSPKNKDNLTVPIFLGLLGLILEVIK